MRLERGGTLNRAQYSSEGCGGTFDPEVIHTFGENTFCRDVAVGANFIYFIKIIEGDTTMYSILSVPKTVITDGQTTIPDDSLNIVPITFTSDHFPLALSLNEETPVTGNSFVEF